MFEMPALLQATPETGLWPGYFRVIFLLAALLCFCWLLLRFVGQRLNGARPRGRAGALEIVDRIGLEPRRTLYVVRAGARYLALASSESGVQLLTDLSPGDFAPQAIEKETGGQP